ncbi:sister chromatid cohesion protein PDS5 homolog B [Trichonephila inaurata madagascariensis]|uniref:Sister chromatid cohesion protein PDS5 homolog B n=1 Tax=Trichonephila inaurata madagascariensis TaxID=2747483 RepID=A0A8X6XUC9_9ARAC|nr:sister chromatid cohesion protein PDS5 homolog B [Trichonephila inaurata madagascariensis]
MIKLCQEPSYAEVISLEQFQVLALVINFISAPNPKGYDDLSSLLKLKDCLWFIMEPLMKHDNYSFSFFKRLLEAIKQTKDRQSPNDDIANLKLYAVSDLALSLVISKTTNFVVKEYPVEPTLPSNYLLNKISHTSI